MEKLQVVLLESVGKIKFGMTRKEVRDNYEVKGEFIKNGFSENLTDDLGFCHVYYNDEETSIGIYGPDREMESILFGEKGYYE